MLNKRIFYGLLMMGYIKLSSAVVPTVDVVQNSYDTDAMSGYAFKVEQFLSSIAKASTVVDEVNQLRELAAFGNTSQTKSIIANQAKLDDLRNFVNLVNEDLCAQFSATLTSVSGINTTAKTLNDVIDMLGSNPVSASLSLQKASIATQSRMHNTLAQIQILLTQQMQKDLLDEKFAEKSTDSIYDGFGNNGL